VCDSPEEDDLTFEQNGVRFVVDAYSATYLEGVVVDYQTSLNASGFKFTNDKAKKTCGCGSSFSV
jgi:iron-sulfur cluster assembly accessory protein